MSFTETCRSSRYHSAAQGGRRLESDYVDTHQVVGRGICGEVTLVRRRADWRRYALKTVRKSQFEGKWIQHLSSEVEIYLTLEHPNIARLYHVYETKDSVCLLMQFCEGGELFRRLRKEGRLQPPDAAEAARQMLRAVGYLHAHNIVHRDIKLENFVYESWASYTNLKMIDFGMAVVWDRSTPLVAQCGSLLYVSPDVLCGEGYTDKCDLWSLGVIAWMLLTGSPPFDGDDETLKRRIRMGQADWSRRGCWENVPRAAKDFVGQLLEKDEAKRPSAQEALQHAWLAPSAATGACPAALDGKILRSLQHYADSCSLRRALLQFVADELEPEETQDLKEVFLALDRTSKGTVSRSELLDAMRHAESLLPAAPTSQTHDGTAPDQANQLRATKREMALPRGAEREKKNCDREAAEEPGPDGAGATAAVERLFKTFAVYEDEQIYFLDFLAATMESLPRVSEDSLRAAFRRLDADGSGVINASHLQQALGGSFEGKGMEELLSEAGLLGHEGLTRKSFVNVLGLGGKVQDEVVPGVSKEDALYLEKDDSALPGAERLGLELCRSLRRQAKIKKTTLADCSVFNFTIEGSGCLVLALLEWTIGVFAPANARGGLGTSAVALFSSPGTPR